MLGAIALGTEVREGDDVIGRLRHTVDGVRLHHPHRHRLDHGGSEEAPRPLLDEVLEKVGSTFKGSPCSGPLLVPACSSATTAPARHWSHHDEAGVLSFRALGCYVGVWGDQVR